MSRKGENIYKRKDGRWEGRYIRDYDEHGKAKYGYVYAASYSETKHRLIESRIRAFNYENSQNKSKGDGDISFATLSEQWLSSIKLKVKESTYTRYVGSINNHIIPKIGHCDVNRITTKDIEDLIENLLTKGRKDGKGGLSTKTVSDIVMIIKSIMNYAEYNNYKLNCHLNKLTVKKDNREMQVISHEEQAALKNVLTENINIYKAGILLSLYTGIRIGELCALKWENIDLENRVLKIRSTMQRIKNTPDNNNINKDIIIKQSEKSKTKVIITEPKTKASIRNIPIPEYMVEILFNFKAADDAWFLTGDAQRYIEPRNLQNYFKRYIKQCGIKDINFHALRHTFATRCIELGFEVKSLSEILGHSSVNITLNKYVHSSFDLKRENMSKLYF